MLSFSVVKRSLRYRLPHHLLRGFLLATFIFPLLLALPVQAARTATLPPAAPNGLSDPKELEAFLDALMTSQMADQHIPGATLSVVKDGKIFFKKGYGDADRPQSKPVSPDTTLFRIGSVSKLFAWTAVMQLVEQGKLDLNTDINTYLKTFRIPDAFSKPITLTHLLAHTPGFEDRATGIFAEKAKDIEPLGKWLAENIPARVRPPGEMSSYSNYGATLAAYIVQQVSGEDFNDYVERHIYQPLNMQQSSFRQPLPANLEPNMSQGYKYEDGLYKADPYELLQVAPAGSMASTASDMANFMIAHLQNGRFGNQRILQEATAQQMHSQLFTRDPHTTGFAYGFYEQNIGNIRLIEHGGDTILFHSLLALIPDKNVGLFVSYNSAGGGAARSSLLQAFVAHYFPSPLPTAEAAPAGFADRVKQIVGNYWDTRKSYTTFEKFGQFGSAISIAQGEGSRIIVSAGGKTQTAEEIAPWVFRQVDGRGIVIFHTSSEGMSMQVDNNPTSALVMQQWYDNATFHYIILGGSILLLLLALLLWPISTLRNVVLRRGLRKQWQRQQSLVGPAFPTATPPVAANSTGQPVPAGPPVRIQNAELTPTYPLQLATRGFFPALVSGLALLLVLFDLFYLFYFVSTISDEKNFIYGVKPAITSLTPLALLSAVLALIVLIGAVVVWVRRYWGVGWRIHYALVALAGLALVWEFSYWNLLKF